MATTKIRGNTQIMDLSIDLGRLEQSFINSSTGNWDITNGAKDALITGIQLMPTDDSDVASKWYVDQRATYAVEWKSSVQFATSTGGVGTYNASGGPLATGSFTSVDFDAGTAFDYGGYTPAVNDRVLVKDQADEKQNGIYTITSTGATGGMYRSADFDGTPSAEVSIGAACFVENGTLYRSTGWTVEKPIGYSGIDGVLALNSDDILWTQFAGVGSYTGGTAIDISGTVINAKYDNTTIGVNVSNQLEVKTGVFSLVGHGHVPGDITGFDEAAEDAVGGILTDTTSVNLDYNDGLDQITATVIVSSTGGLEITAGGVGVKADGIKDTMIDWGTSTGQVSAADMPIADIGDYYAVDTVEAALQELGVGLAGAYTFKTVATPFGTNPEADSTTDTLTLQSSSGAIVITGIAATDTIDFTIAVDGIKDTMIDFGTSTGQVSGVDIPIADVDNYYSTDNVEAALKQIGDGLVGPYTFKTISTPSGTSPVADSVADTLTLLSAGPITITGSSGADSVTFGIGNSGIKDSMIDWGTSTGQVSAADIPVADVNNYYTSTGLEGILQEIGALLPTMGFTEVWGESPAVVNNTYTATLAHTPQSVTEVKVYLNGLRQRYGAGADYTIAGTTITFVSKLRTNDELLVDYRW